MVLILQQCDQSVSDARPAAGRSQIVTVDPTDPWAWFTLTGRLQISGQTNEAWASLDSLRRLNPDVTIAKLRVGDIRVSPVFRKAEGRPYAALTDARMPEGADPHAAPSANSPEAVASQLK
jgi:hypothetical protein